MPYITREDGERFIIPSYRDVLAAKKPGLLKREILLLASNYGDYITLQKKSSTQYEVAFSTEPGTLLGESIWYHFKRPRDLIYCEAIPNTADAILVIVKSGSVYLDGSFPLDSIPEELVVFQTQQNNFAIYLYGDVPISEEPQEGKFTFDSTSVASFKILDKPVFPKLPLLKPLRLQLVDIVLKQQGIGVFPLRNLVMAMMAAGLLWMGWMFIVTHKEQLPEVIISAVNPYQSYMTSLSRPDPSIEIKRLTSNILLFYTIPGWFPVTFTYTTGQLNVAVKSLGSRTNVLFDWAKKNNAEVDIRNDGFYVNKKIVLSNRFSPRAIYELKYVLANLTDRLSYVMQGNPLKIGNFSNRGSYTETDITINFVNITPTTLDLIADQFKRLPLVLSNVTASVSDGNLSGKIELKALGN